jgi:hypothetical protein
MTSAEQIELEIERLDAFGQASTRQAISSIEER